MNAIALNWKHPIETTKKNSSHSKVNRTSSSSYVAFTIFCFGFRFRLFVGFPHAVCNTFNIRIMCFCEYPTLLCIIHLLLDKFAYWILCSIRDKFWISKNHLFGILSTHFNNEWKVDAVPMLMLILEEAQRNAFCEHLLTHNNFVSLSSFICIPMASVLDASVLMANWHEFPNHLPINKTSFIKKVFFLDICFAKRRNIVWLKSMILNIIQLWIKAAPNSKEK